MLAYMLQQLLLKSIPSFFELKCRAYSLLSQCYQLVGAIPSQKQILNKALELISTSEDGYVCLLLHLVLLLTMSTFAGIT